MTTKTEKKKCIIYAISDTRFDEYTLSKAFKNYNKNYENYSSINIKYAGATDLTIEPNIDIEIKWKTKLDRNTVDFIKNDKNAQYYILYISNYTNLGIQLIIKNESTYLKQLSKNATIIISVIEPRSNFSSTITIVKKALPFIEYVLPITDVNKDPLYEV